MNQLIYISLIQKVKFTAHFSLFLNQANGGVLDDQQAMRMVNGLAGPTPIPRMMGMELPTGMAPLTAAPAPSLPTRPAPAAPLQGSSSVTTPAYPPLAPDKASSYQTAFEQLDGDRDGLVQGVDCFPALMRSGLPKDTLKAIWDVVAGDAGYLNRHQFVQCLYLVDCAKIGIPVPAVLPQGQFPPAVGGMGLQGMMGQSQQTDIYTQGPLFVPPMQPRAFYVPGQAPAVAFQSQVPPAPTNAQAAGLAAAEAARLKAEREEALRQEAERQRAEEERVAAVSRREYFTQALASLRVAQSKVQRTLVEAEQRLEMERTEADGMEGQYNAAYELFSTEHARAAPLLAALKSVEDEKAELAAKMAALQSAVAQLEDYDPEWEAREKAECDGMKKDITELTVKHEALQQARAAVLAQRETLQASIAAVSVSAERAQSSLETVSSEVTGLDAEAKQKATVVVSLLQRLAPLYNELYAAAKGAMIPLPKEALATIARPAASAFKYDPLRFGVNGAATDWDSFTDEGFTIAATVAPDARLLSLTSTSLVEAENVDNSHETTVDVDVVADVVDDVDEKEGGAGVVENGEDCGEEEEEGQEEGKVGINGDVETEEGVAVETENGDKEEGDASVDDHLMRENVVFEQVPVSVVETEETAAAEEEENEGDEEVEEEQTTAPQTTATMVDAFDAFATLDIGTKAPAAVAAAGVTAVVDEAVEAVNTAAL